MGFLVTMLHLAFWFRIKVIRKAMHAYTVEWANLTFTDKRSYGN